MEQMEFDFQKQPGKKRTRFYSPDVKTALVSIITPFYNAGKYFEQTFNSVMNQTFPWFEWIIVNDGSTNQEDVELLHGLAAMDQRVKVVTQKNGGLSCARNTGIGNAHTDLIVPLDADDVLAPGYLECLYWAMYYNPDAAWCYTSSYGFHDQEYIWKYPFNSEKLKTYNFLNYTAMIRKKDILEVGGYKVEKWSYYEDWRLWLEMLSMRKKPVHVNSCLFWYRRLNSGMLSTINKDPARVKFCKEIIKKAGEHVDTTVQALEYPVRNTKYPFYTAKKIEWDRKSYDSHHRRRILWLVPWLVMGGSDKFNLDAIAGLKEKGFDSFIITTKPSENEWQQKFEEHTDEIFSLPDFLDPAHYLEFVSYYIQSREIDIIMLTNSYEGYYMLPWIRQHFPDVAIVDYVHMEEWYWRNGGYARTSGMLGAVTEKTYVCNSATQKVMVEHFGRKSDTVETVYIGVDEKYFDREVVPAGLLCKSLNIAPNRPVVLFICRLHPQKRPFLMLEIARKTAKIIPDIVFAVVGSGYQEREMKKTVRKLHLENNVFFLGMQKDVRPYYRDAKLTLVCSLKEGLSLTAYESCAMGVPVISADVGGQRDLIDSSVGALIPIRQKEMEDIDARVFPESEVDDYVNAIIPYLTDVPLWEETSNRCRTKIEEAFTIDKMVNYFSKEFERLLTDETLRQQRHELAEALQLSSPLTAELYTIETQMQDAENLWCGNNAESLVSKIRRTLQEEGLSGVVRKILRRIIRPWKK